MLFVSSVGFAFAVQFKAVPAVSDFQRTVTTKSIDQPTIKPIREPTFEQKSNYLREEPDIVVEQVRETKKVVLEGSGNELSEFELFITGKISESVSTDIRQFGYELFRFPPSTFAPADTVPVGPDYVIGPGDEIRVTLWGSVEGEWDVFADREGNISLPKVGVLGVAGLSFKDVKELLRKEFSRYYTGFQMNVSMGALRSITVYIVGNARQPGAYTLSSFSTLINALFEAGGPSKSGSMRDIQLKRNGETVVTLDLYDFLLEGDKSNDVRLLPEDVIFIPPVGKLVGIAGYVKKPAIYEMKGDMTVADLITMAGGLTSNAFKGRLQVQRIEDHRYVTIFEENIFEIESDEERNFVLMDGDLVKVFSVYEDKNSIVISGAVAFPGKYGIVPGETRLSVILSLSGGLLYYASNTAEVTRVIVTQDGPVTERMTVDLSKTLQGEPGHDIALEKNDYVIVRPVPDWQLHKIVNIRGEVRFPGTYTIKKGERLSSLLERAGGFTEKAYLRGAVFTRETVREIQQKRIDEMIERLETELLGTSITETASALSADAVRIKEAEIRQKQAFVSKLRSVKAVGRMAIVLREPELLKTSDYDIELEDGDGIFIPADPQSVQVIGSVYNQTAFIYAKDKAYSEFIDMAGGYTRNADKKNVYILKADGTAVKPDKGILWNGQSNRWEFGSSSLESGDTIVVPERLERISWMREIKDLTQILYQIAVTAGVLIVAF